MEDENSSSFLLQRWMLMTEPVHTRGVMTLCAGFCALLLRSLELAQTCDTPFLLETPEPNLNTAG